MAAHSADGFGEFYKIPNDSMKFQNAVLIRAFRDVTFPAWQRNNQPSPIVLISS